MGLGFLEREMLLCLNSAACAIERKEPHEISSI